MEKLPERYVSSVPVSEIQIDSLLSQALDKGVDVLERILAMREKLEAERAKALYTHDMLAFQEECPSIPKTRIRYGTSGQPVSKYAPLETIVSIVRPLAAQKGFTFRFDTKYTEREIHVTCVIRHIGGHEEVICVPLPSLDTNKMMNESQARIGTITMAKREALCNAFGLAPVDEDTENFSPAPQYATKEQVQELTSILQERNISVEQVCTQAKVESLELLSYAYMKRIIDYFKQGE